MSCYYKQMRPTHGTPAQNPAGEPAGATQAAAESGRPKPKTASPGRKRPAQAESGQGHKQPSANQSRDSYIKIHRSENQSQMRCDGMRTLQRWMPR